MRFEWVVGKRLAEFSLVHRAARSPAQLSDRLANGFATLASEPLDTSFLLTR